MRNDVLMKRFRTGSYEPPEGVSSPLTDSTYRDLPVTFNYRKNFDTDPLT